VFEEIWGGRRENFHIEVMCNVHCLTFGPQFIGLHPVQNIMQENVLIMVAVKVLVPLSVGGLMLLEQWVSQA
jgi:hypothetical protein